MKREEHEGLGEKVSSALKESTWSPFPWMRDTPTLEEAEFNVS